MGCRGWQCKGARAVVGATADGDAAGLNVRTVVCLRCLCGCSCDVPRRPVVGRV